MIRSEKLSGVLSKFIKPLFVRAGVSNGVSARVLGSIVLLFAASFSAAGIFLGTDTPSIKYSGFEAFATPTPPQVLVFAPLQNATVGSSFDAPVTVTSITGLNVLSFDFEVNFDPAVIIPQIPAADNSGTISAGRLVTINQDVPGTLYVSVFGATAMSGAGTLINFKFTAVGAIGTQSPVHWNTIPGPGHIIFRFNEGIPTSQTIDGAITIVGPTATSTPTASSTATTTTTPTNTSTPTATITRTATNTPTNTATATFTATATVTATSTPSATSTSTFTPSATATGTFTATPTATGTFTATPTSTGTFTPTPTATGTFTPTATATGTFTATATATGTFTATPTATGTLTATATATATGTFSATPSSTSTFTPTAIATSTLTSTATGTATATATAAATPSLQFSSQTYMEDESQVAVITILRTGSLSGTDSVAFSTSNGTAAGGAVCSQSNGVDYISVIAQTVIFAPNETSKNVNIPLCGDGIIENDETVNLTLGGSFIGFPGTAVLTINDTATGFLSPGKIFVNQGGAANPYPSTINVTGVQGVIGQMRLTLYDISTNVPDNADFLLVAPGGQSMIIMANAGGSAPGGPVTLNFTDGAGAVVPDNGPLFTTDYEPTSYGTVANFPAPAPVGPYNLPGSAIGGTGTQTLGGNFNSTFANGIWRLYVRDDFATPGAVVGSIAGGWGLEFLRATAAGASISGRVSTAGGAGIRNARVVVTGNSLAEPVVTTTGSFGYFSFDGLMTGETYVVTVNSQRYTFSTPSRVISLVDNVIDADFTADPQE